jgi:hypothetical protein
VKICITYLLCFNKKLKIGIVEVTTAIDEVFVRNNLCEVSGTLNDNPEENIISGNVAACSLTVFKCFGGIYLLPLQGRRVSRVNKQLLVIIQIYFT